MKKMGKIISAAAAAAVCCSMVSGMAVAAEEYTYDNGTAVIAEMNAADPIWTECKTLSGGKYSSAYVKMAQSYSKKKATKAVTYGKSRTKSFLNKLEKAANAKEPNVSIALISKDTVIASAVKGNKAKVVMYMPSGDMNVSLAIYTDSKTMTMLSPETKMKITQEIPEGTDSAEAAGADISGILSDSGITDSTKGKVFKFTNNGKNYVYEEFETAEGGKMGVLFDSSNKPIAMLDDTGVYCCTFSTSVKDSAFKVPSGYAEMEM